MTQPLDITMPLIRAMSLEVDGIVIEYCIPVEDARANGVVLNHTLMVPLGDQYDEGIADLKDAAIALLRDVLEDLPVMDPIRPPVPDDEDADDEDDD